MDEWEHLINVTHSHDYLTRGFYRNIYYIINRLVTELLFLSMKLTTTANVHHLLAFISFCSILLQLVFLCELIFRRRHIWLIMRWSG